MQKTSVFSDFYCLPNKLALMGEAPTIAFAAPTGKSHVSMKVIQPDRLIPTNPVSHFCASTTSSGS
jgi:hypothetical protein